MIERPDVPGASAVGRVLELLDGIRRAIEDLPDHAVDEARKDRC